MDSTAIRYEKLKTYDTLLPRRGANIYSSGLSDKDKGFVKYGPPSSDQPTLIITNPIYDEDGNGILPGYYELSLSYDRSNLILSQNGDIMAVVPVVKVEEDKSQTQQAPMDRKSLKKSKKEQKKKEKLEKKLKRDGKIEDMPEVYNKASIEHVTDGDYYMIKYERAQIKAWGAIKF